MIVLVLIVAGLMCGSFVNAFVWRLHKGKDWVNERSECTHCHHVLAPKDLVPVLSYLWLRGKCRYCHKPIEDSPFVELVVPALFVLSYLYWPGMLIGGGWFDFIVWLLCLVGFTALAVYDLRWMLLPNVIVFPLMALTGFKVLVDWLFLGGDWQSALQAVLAAGLLSGFFFLLHTVSKGKWIGFGDVKLAIPLGLLAQQIDRAVLLLFLASFIGTLIAVPLLLRRKAKRTSLLPFGPLLLLATFIVVLHGADIIDWYTAVLLGL